MEKIIKIKNQVDANGKPIGDIEIPVRSTAGSLFVYKSNFGRDGIKDLLALGKNMPTIKEDATEEEMMQALAESDFSFDVFYRFLWVFARSKNPDIPPIEQWLDSLDVAPLDFFIEVLPQVKDLILNNIKSGVKSKN